MLISEGLGTKRYTFRNYLCMCTYVKNFLYFHKKYVEAAINDFTIHLIILKWIRR